MEHDNPMNVSVILAMANSLGGPNPFLPRISTAPITAEIPPNHTKQNKEHQRQNQDLNLTDRIVTLFTFKMLNKFFTL